MNKASTQRFDLSFSQLWAVWSLGSLGEHTESGCASAPTVPFEPLAQARRGQPLADAQPPPPAVHDLPSELAPRVLVSKGAQRPPDLFKCKRLESLREQGRVYCIEPAELRSLDEVEHHCHAQAPRVLLLDVNLAREAGPSAVRQLRRRLPATDWLLGWDSPLTNDLDVALLSQMRGCVAWAVGAPGLVHALDAVVAGELWFPRALLESLYLSLLDAGASQTPGKPGKSAAQTYPSLTAREAEVRALMRHGLTNRQIAQQLGVSINTVKKHLAHMFEKRGLRGRRQDLL